MADLFETLRAVVLPAVEAVFRDDELSSVEVRREGGSVRLVLTAQGETYSDDVVQAGVPGQSLMGWEERLRSNLVDFVAESHSAGARTEVRRPPGRETSSRIDPRQLLRDRGGTHAHAELNATGEFVWRRVGAAVGGRL